mmetsp:Transcript_32038/g.73690  ORF Transcript_32038/g.73690 Transcript_32038/m.73690 type:complete len:210 (+) Transcript_32038:640-1269(+)
MCIGTVVRLEPRLRLLKKGDNRYVTVIFSTFELLSDRKPLAVVRYDPVEISSVHEYNFRVPSSFFFDAFDQADSFGFWNVFLVECANFRADCFGRKNRTVPLLQKRCDVVVQGYDAFVRIRRSRSVKVIGRLFRNPAPESWGFAEISEGRRRCQQTRVAHERTLYRRGAGLFRSDVQNEHRIRRGVFLNFTADVFIIILRYHRVFVVML